LREALFAFTFFLDFCSLRFQPWVVDIFEIIKIYKNELTPVGNRKFL